MQKTSGKRGNAYNDGICLRYVCKFDEDKD